MKIARNLKLIYDGEHDYHPEYENYRLGDEVKQADTILSGYPLLYGMNE